MRKALDALWGLALLLVLGTLVFGQVEGWTVIDSFYFTGVTMLTIGYGDITPITDAGKILTVVFGMMSISLVFFALASIGREVNKRIPSMPFADHLSQRTGSSPNRRNSANQALRVAGRARP